MTASIWTRYADRRPTKEDADEHGRVIALWIDGAICDTQWDFDCNPEAWCRIIDLNHATGYVKPRRLHPAWRELRADSWRFDKRVWVLRNGEVDRAYGTAGECVEANWTHWQPCDPPQVWENET